MEILPVTAPIEEQALCIPCGFCCDATLFGHATLHPGEKGNLPEKIEEAWLIEDGKEYFSQPCLYFDKKCTIYDKKRAYVCGSYRCQLLKDFADKKITGEQALSIIKNAKSTRYELIRDFNTLSHDNRSTNFRQLLLEMGKLQKATAGNIPLSMDFEMFIARCNIFEAHLIKYFRAASEFESMICSSEQ